MQVFNTFFRIAKKKIPSIIMYFVIFMIIMFMMSAFGGKNPDSSFESTSLDICVIDEDNSDASKALTDYLGSIHTLVDLKSTDKESLQDNLYYQRISYVLTIPKGFEEKLLAGETENIVESSMRPDSGSGFFVTQQVDTYLTSLKLYLTGGYDVTAAIEKTADNISDLAEVEMLQFDNKAAKHADSQMFDFFQYLPYILICLLIIGMTPILITFNRKDLASRITCSSMSLTSKNMQLGLACIAYSLVIWLIFMAAGTIVYKPEMMFSSFGLYCILNSFVFLLIVTAIVLLLSTFALSDNTLNLISNIIGLGMSFICGIFIPQWLLDEKVLSAARFLPAYWYVRIINMLNGRSGEDVCMSTYWECIGIELAFFAAIFALYLVANQGKKKHAAN